MTMDDFIQELGVEFPNLDTDEIKAVVTGLAAIGPCTTDMIREVLKQKDQDSGILEEYGLDENLSETWFPNIHGRELGEQLKDFFEEYDLV